MKIYVLLSVVSREKSCSLLFNINIEIGIVIYFWLSFKWKEKSYSKGQIILIILDCHLFEERKISWMDAWILFRCHIFIWECSGRFIIFPFSYLNIDSTANNQKQSPYIFFLHFFPRWKTLTLFQLLLHLDKYFIHVWILVNIHTYNNTCNDDIS